MQAYCKKSCNICDGNRELTCSGLNRTCNTGTCSSVVFAGRSTIRCNCPSNTAGSYCEVTATGCSLITCQNGANCLLNANGSPYCVCQNGFSGTNCQTCIKIAEPILNKDNMTLKFSFKY